MVGDNSNDEPGTSPASGELATLAAALGPRADLTYQTLEGLTLHGRSLKQSLFTGAILRRATFNAVDMSRCDLDGMRIEGSTFVDCDFTNVDMRSSTISRSRFENCTFASTYLVDNVFAEVSFVRCRFPSAVVSDCSLDRCHLTMLDMAESSFTHNRFSATEFVDTLLGNCTFLYSVMSGCTFIGTTKINAESIGMSYGLTTTDIASFDLVYLGEDQMHLSRDELIPALLEVYTQRRWQIGVCVLRLNCSLTGAAYALEEYLRLLREEDAAEQPLKRDQLLFFVAVLQELASTRQLPLLSCVNAVDTVTHLASSHEARADDSRHASTALRTLSARLFMLLQTLLRDLELSAIEFDATSNDRSLLTSFVFSAKPTMAMASLLNELSAAAGLPVLHESRTIEARAGSYIEIVQTTILTLGALRLGFFLVKGCLIEVTETRARLEVLFRKNLPLPYRQAALSPRHDLPTYLAAPLQRLVGWATGFVASGEPGLKGLPPPNLMSIEVSPEQSIGSESTLIPPS